MDRINVNAIQKKIRKLQKPDIRLRKALAYLFESNPQNNAYDKLLDLSSRYWITSIIGMIHLQNG